MRTGLMILVLATMTLLPLASFANANKPVSACDTLAKQERLQKIWESNFDGYLQDDSEAHSLMDQDGPAQEQVDQDTQEITSQLKDSSSQARRLLVGLKAQKRILNELAQTTTQTPPKEMVAELDVYLKEAKAGHIGTEVLLATGRKFAIELEDTINDFVAKSKMDSQFASCPTGRSMIESKKSDVRPGLPFSEYDKGAL